MYVSAAQIAHQGTQLAPDLANLDQVALTGASQQLTALQHGGEQYQGGTGVLTRKLNRRGNWNGSVFTPDPLNGSHVLFVLRNNTLAQFIKQYRSSRDRSNSTDAESVNPDMILTIPSFLEFNFSSRTSPVIPVDIRIESNPSNQ
jgi:hypothetical protein